MKFSEWKEFLNVYEEILNLSNFIKELFKLNVDFNIQLLLFKIIKFFVCRNNLFEKYMKKYTKLLSNLLIFMEKNYSIIRFRNSIFMKKKNKKFNFYEKNFIFFIIFSSFMFFR